MRESPIITPDEARLEARQSDHLNLDSLFDLFQKTERAREEFTVWAAEQGITNQERARREKIILRAEEALTLIEKAEQAVKSGQVSAATVMRDEKFMGARATAEKLFASGDLAARIEQTALLLEQKEEVPRFLPSESFNPSRYAVENIVAASRELGLEIELYLDEHILDRNEFKPFEPLLRFLHDETTMRQLAARTLEGYQRQGLGSSTSLSWLEQEYAAVFQALQSLVGQYPDLVPVILGQPTVQTEFRTKRGKAARQKEIEERQGNIINIALAHSAATLLDGTNEKLLGAERRALEHLYGHVPEELALDPEILMLQMEIDTFVAEIKDEKKRALIKRGLEIISARAPGLFAKWRGVDIESMANFDWESFIRVYEDEVAERQNDKAVRAQQKAMENFISRLISLAQNQRPFSFELRPTERIDIEHSRLAEAQYATIYGLLRYLYAPLVKKWQTSEPKCFAVPQPLQAPTVRHSGNFRQAYIRAGYAQGDRHTLWLKYRQELAHTLERYARLQGQNESDLYVQLRLIENLFTCYESDRVQPEIFREEQAWQLLREAHDIEDQLEFIADGEWIDPKKRTRDEKTEKLTDVLKAATELTIFPLGYTPELQEQMKQAREKLLAVQFAKAAAIGRIGFRDEAEETMRQLTKKEEGPYIYSDEVRRPFLLELTTWAKEAAHDGNFDHAWWIMGRDSKKHGVDTSFKFGSYVFSRLRELPESAIRSIREKTVTFIRDAQFEIVKEQIRQETIDEARANFKKCYQDTTPPPFKFVELLADADELEAANDEFYKKRKELFHDRDDELFYLRYAKAKAKAKIAFGYARAGYFEKATRMLFDQLEDIEIYSLSTTEVLRETCADIVVYFADKNQLSVLDQMPEIKEQALNTDFNISKARVAIARALIRADRTQDTQIFLKTYPLSLEEDAAYLHVEYTILSNEKRLTHGPFSPASSPADRNIDSGFKEHVIATELFVNRLLEQPTSDTVSEVKKILADIRTERGTIATRAPQAEYHALELRIQIKLIGLLVGQNRQDEARQEVEKLTGTERLNAMAAYARGCLEQAVQLYRQNARERGDLRPPLKPLPKNEGAFLARLGR